MHAMHLENEYTVVSGGLFTMRKANPTATAQSCMPKAFSISSKLPTSTYMLHECPTGSDRHPQCLSVNADATNASVHHDQCRLQILLHVHGLCYKPNLRRGVVNGVRMPGVAMELRCLSLASCSFCTSSAAVAAFRSATACICSFMTALCSFSFCRCSMREV